MNYTFDPVPVNKFRKLPYMYKIIEGDDKFFYPEEDKIPYLIQAFEFLNNGGSLRKACSWLETEADRKVSVQGLNNLWKRHHSDIVLDRHIKLQNISEGNKPKTREARARRKKNRAIGRLKQQITVNEKKLARIAEEKRSAERNEVFDGTVTIPNDHGGFEVEVVPESQDIVFTPNPGPQTDFLSSSETEVLYGGSAGGEPKTWFYRLLLQ